jgi:hypothetical protein
MPKDQSKKMHVKKSAKNRAIEKNEEDFKEIIYDLTLAFENLKKNLGKDATKDKLENKEIFLGKVQLGHGFMFQVKLANGQIIQVSTPGNLALHDMIKQVAVGTENNEDMQPYILILKNQRMKTGETLCLISDNNPEITEQRFELLKQAGIQLPIKAIDEIIFEAEEKEINVEDL